MLVIVSFDISNNKRRRLVNKVLLTYGNRILKSVFHLEIHENQYLPMKFAIGDIVEEKEDSIRFYWVCGKCINKIETIGNGGNHDLDIDDITFIL